MKIKIELTPAQADIILDALQFYTEEGIADSGSQEDQKNANAAYNATVDSVAAFNALQHRRQLAR